MPTPLAPLNEIRTRSAIRRDRVGFRVNNPVVDRLTFDAACREFFLSRGLPVTNAFNERFSNTENKDEP